MSANPAVAVKAPRSQSLPTLPFDEADVENMLAAADTVATNAKYGARNRKRVRAMILLLRYSGLLISDASTLERSRLEGTKQFP
jgi:site-specific recombinase XerD